MSSRRWWATRGARKVTHAASRLSAQLPHAEEVLGFDLELMTAATNDVNWPVDALASTHCGRELEPPPGPGDDQPVTP